MSQILINTPDILKLRQCHTHLRDLCQFLGVFEVQTLSKLNITLKIIANMTKITELTILSKTLTCILNKKKELLLIPCLFLRPVMIFLVVFWDAKIVKREYNLKNIRKSLKRTLTNNFVENFKI